MDYIKLAREFKLNNQYWYAETKDGFTISCGFGLNQDEFSLLTFENMDKYCLQSDLDWNEEWKMRGKGGIIKPLDIIDGYWTLDGTCKITDTKGSVFNVKDIYDIEHPNEDSFRLIPKEDIVKTYFLNKAKPTFKIINT